MRTHYHPRLKGTVTVDDANRIRGISHLDEYREMKSSRGRSQRGREAAAAYIRDIARELDIPPEALRNLEQPLSHNDPRQQAMEYWFSLEKVSFDLTTCVFCQTYLNTPIWAAGISVTLKQAPGRAGARIVGATNTNEQDFEATLPPVNAIARYRRIFEGSERLTDILGSATRVATKTRDATSSPRLIGGQFFIYRYDANRRTDDDAATLPLPPVPNSIRDRSWYFVAEIVFQLPHESMRMNWRMLVEVETNTIVYLRALSSGLITGKVFPYDPVTSSGKANYTAGSSNAVLNRLRTNEKLHNLKPPTGKPRIQSLRGKWAKLTNITSPDFKPPTRPAGRNFDRWNVRCNEFAAVNAYYHVDRFFRLVEDLGFKMTGPSAYFGKTKFPIEVDHRAFRPPWPDGNVINAAVVGDGKGIDAVYFALADFSGGFVAGVTVNNCGSNYTRPPKVELVGGLGTGAKAKVKPQHVVNGAIKKVTLLKGGRGYRVAPLVKFSGGGGNGAFAEAEINVSDPIGIATDWRVTLHELGGHGTLFSHVGESQFGFAHSAGDSFAMILNDYASEWHNKGVPNRFLLLPFVPGPTSRLSNRALTEKSVANVIVSDGGSGYLTVTLAGGGVAAAEVRPQDIVGGAVTRVTVTDGGAGYTSAPQIIFAGGRGTGLEATAQISSGSVTGVTVNDAGSGYTSPPTVSFTGGGIEGARAGIRTDRIVEGRVTKVTVIDPGKGYTGRPSVTISGGGGTGANATANIDAGSVTHFTVNDGGRHYKPLEVKFSGSGGATASISPADIVGGAVSKVTVVNPGAGYKRDPKVRFKGGGGGGAKAIAQTGTWGWGQGMDRGTDGKLGSGYFSEQILSTTMFRAYQSIGGDATSINRREFAARSMAFLMLQAIAQCNPTNNPKLPAEFLDKLLKADCTDWTSEGMAGGAYRKVLEWAFEKQNLKNSDPPDVDVYIEDGRRGEYQYDPVYWASTAIWNRRSPDGLGRHQEPALGAINYAYVKIKNRGKSVANNVVVKGYHYKPSVGVILPNDLQPMTTPQLSGGVLQPLNAEEKTVGPFQWIPMANGWGHDGMLMIVSADGDNNNLSTLSAGEVFEDWRVVPHDNNVAQRNVVLVPGGGGSKGLKAALHRKGLWVRNAGRRSAKIAVAVTLPPLLARRGWRVALRGLAAKGALLKPSAQRLVTYVVRPGRTFTKASVLAAAKRDMVVSVTADGAIIGGAIYKMDPTLDMPFNDGSF